MKVSDCREGDVIRLQTGSCTGALCRVVEVTPESKMVRVRKFTDDGCGYVDHDNLISKRNDCVLIVRKWYPNT